MANGNFFLSTSSLELDCRLSRVRTCSILHDTQGIIREATAALLEDVRGHWFGGLPGEGMVGAHEYGGTLDYSTLAIYIAEE